MNNILDDNVDGLEFALNEGREPKLIHLKGPRIVRTLYVAEGKGKHEGESIIHGNTDSLEATKEHASERFDEFDIVATHIYNDGHTETEVVEEIRL